MKLSSSQIKHILMINLHSSRNAGDAALTVVAVKQLKMAFPRATITLAMNDPASHTGDEPTVGSFMTWIKRVDGPVAPRWQWPGLLLALILRSLVAAFTYRLLGTPYLLFLNAAKKDLLRAYFDADIVVSCAGNFLYSSGGIGIPLGVTLYTMAFAQFSKKPLYTMPQSIGPFLHRWERWWAKRIYSHAQLVLAREPISYRLIQTLGISSDRCFCIPDIAFALTAESADAGKQLLERYGIALGQQPLLGITVINWAAQNHRFESQSKYESAVAFAIRSFVERLKGTAIFFAQVTGPTDAEDDRVAARRVQQLLADLGDRVVIIDEVCSAGLLKSMYGLMDLFVGTRMHSNIFALSQQVPVVAIEYFHKTSGIMQLMELERWVVNIRSVEPEQLERVLENAWLERERTRNQLADKLPMIVNQTQQAGKLIARYVDAAA